MSKLIVFDVETSFMQVNTFTLHPEHIPYTSIVQDWYMLSAAWKEVGEKKTHGVKINDFRQRGKGDDKGVVSALRDALADADVLIGQNIKRFDIPKLNARLVYHRLKPLPRIPVLDTLKEIKKIAQFPSHRLDYLGKHLLGHGKLQNPPDLWEQCMAGDKKALNHLLKYNKIDVERTEELFELFRPYFTTNVHLGAIAGKGRASCPNCGSTHFKKNGLRYTATGLSKQECQCRQCHHFFRLPIK